MRGQINIDNFLGGFAPAWYKETYPSFGNKNQAGTMTNIDLTNAGYMCQGAGLANLTNGTQAVAITTLIKGMTDFAVTTDTAYGVGGNKLYQFSSTAVTVASPFNGSGGGHVIDKAVVTSEDGEDVAYYQGNLYYSYNHSTPAGDVGQYNLISTFDDDYMSTVPTGGAVLAGSVPHPMCAAGNDVLYIANGRYVASFDGSEFIAQALDLPPGSVIVALRWSGDRLWISVNRPNLTGSNKNAGSIYIWDGTTDSWESEIKMMGTMGGLHVRNGVVFVFYQDITSTGGYKLGYLDGSRIGDLANFTGGLPAFYQISDYKDFIIWNSNGNIWAWGAGDKDLPVRLFQLADGGYATIGGVVCPFGTPIIASWDAGTNYKLAKFSGYDVNSSWKSLMFDLTSDNNNPGKMDCVRLNFETLASGARVDWKLLDNGGRTIYSDIISFAKLGAVTTAYYPLNGKLAENMRVEFDYANGSTSATVMIKNVKTYENT